MQYEIENELMTAKGFTWNIRKARTQKDAQQAVINALATGTEGYKRTLNGEVVVDVMKVNDNE